MSNDYEKLTDTPHLFWKGVIRALDASPIEDDAIQGASGLSHRILAGGVDEKYARLIIILPETNSRAAVLVQQDIQGAVSDNQVLAIRPVFLNLPEAATAFVRVAGRTIVSTADMKEDSKFVSTFKGILEPHFDEIKSILKWDPRIAEAIVGQFYDQLKQLRIAPSPIGTDAHLLTNEGGPTEAASLDISNLVNRNILLGDLDVGICPMPFYQISNVERELFICERKSEDAEKVLRRIGLTQFFRPSPDSLAIGVLGRRKASPDRVISLLERAPQLGHPFGKNEIVTDAKDLRETVEQLKDAGYVAEITGEFELSEQGKRLRRTVRLRPQESVVTRIIQCISKSKLVEYLASLRSERKSD